ncbi:MAG: ComEC/Rec2 family competence protein [Chloroflexota bacterium]|nr:ComEC/Rec2 family competence protein [Chloroflexota bacterium]
MQLIVFSSAWAVGISVSRVLLAMPPSFWFAAFAVSLCGGLVFRRRVAWWIFASLIAFFAGGFRQSLAPASSEIAAYNGHSGTITGLVVSQPRLREDRVQFRLASENIFTNSELTGTSGLVLVEADRGAEVQYGDRIRATGKLALPATWDTFSYADYLGRQGVFSIMQNAGLEVVDSGYGSPLIASLLKLRTVVQRSIASALPEPQAGLLTGILLGDEDGISRKLKDDFSRVGASHVVAISGFNMVIVSGIVVRVMSTLFRRNRVVVTLNALSVIAVYALFVGASPGILRAALMSGLLVVGSQLNRKTFVPTSLAFATLLLSLGDPSVLLDIGFQLSFLAVLGLSLFADPLSTRFRRLLDRLLPIRAASVVHSFLNEPLIVSIAAQITTLPLIILYFGRLSLVALPVNILIVPVQTAVLLLGMTASVVYAFMPAIGTLIYWADLVFVSWTIAVVRAFADLEFAEIVVHLDGRLIQAFYLLLIGGAMGYAARPPIWHHIQEFVRRHTVVLAVIATSATALILMGAVTISRADGRLQVWLLDIGHSNAVLAQTPGGAQILVDGGRFPARLLTAIGDRLPFYDREIEILAITHPDAWDIAALNSVLERYSVDAVLYHGQPNRDPTVDSIFERLRQSDTQIVEVKAGYTVEFADGAMLEVLHPQTQPKITDRLNDNALVLRLSYGDASFLLTADLSVEGQRELIATGVAMRASVLQIPQHGTARALDDDFLSAVQPQIALLQIDIANRRGDPDPDTLGKLRGVDLFRTDEIGTIHLRTDGKTILVSR